MGSFLAEWRNTNAHRQFPLDDSSSGKDASGNFIIPPALLVDLRVDAPHDSDPGEFAVTKVLVSGVNIRVEISYLLPTPFVIGTFTLSPGAFAKESSMAGESTEDPIWRGLAGTIAQGYLDEALKSPGDWDIPVENGRINPACVRIGPSGVRALVVDGVPLYGTVVLRAGANVSIDRSVDEDGNDILNISSASPETGLVIRNDQELLDALIDRFGEPIRTINNIPPNEYGNFDIFGADCVSVDPGSGAITIKNPCGDPCCDKEEYLGALYEALNDLNARYSRLVQFEDAMTDSVNMMQNKLGVLHMGLQRD